MREGVNHWGGDESLLFASSDQRPLERDVKTVPELKLVSQLSLDKIKLLLFQVRLHFVRNFKVNHACLHVNLLFLN